MSLLILKLVSASGLRTLEDNRTGDKTYMSEKNLENWVIKATNYKELNNVLIPTAFEVLWRLDTGDFSYAKFNVREVIYGKPEKF